MGLNGQIVNQVRHIIDAAGRVIGYRNLATDQDEAVLTASQVAAVAELLTNGHRRVLKATTGAVQLTGGVAGTKTTLMQVTLPDEWLSDPTVRLVIEYAVNYTNSANVKNYGIDIGATAGTAVAIRTQAPTTTASETTLLVMQRSTSSPSRFYLTIPNNFRLFGNAAGAGATAGVLASASIDPAATGQSLFFWATINPNTEQVTFEHIYVALERSEQ